VRILHVEDHDEVADLATHELSRRGHEVTWARTTSEALALLDAHLFDAFVLDYLLPDGSAEPILRAARERYGGARVPVVVVANRGDDRADSLAIVLYKPVDWDELAEVLRLLYTHTRS
jgi:DNA-binding response OmpR family regulator